MYNLAAMAVCGFLACGEISPSSMARFVISRVVSGYRTDLKTWNAASSYVMSFACTPLLSDSRS